LNSHLVAVVVVVVKVMENKERKVNLFNVLDLMSGVSLHLLYQILDQRYSLRATEL